DQCGHSTNGNCSRLLTGGLKVRILLPAPSLGLSHSGYLHSPFKRRDGGSIPSSPTMQPSSNWTRPGASTSEIGVRVVVAAPLPWPSGQRRSGPNGDNRWFESSRQFRTCGADE